MRRSRAMVGLPLAVTRALAKLGEDLSSTRRRQQISMEILAERAFITRKTLGRVERGDPKVSLGIYATVVYVLGMLDRLAMVADASADRLGQALEEERLPKRVRARSR